MAELELLQEKPVASAPERPWLRKLVDWWRSIWHAGAIGEAKRWQGQYKTDDFRREYLPSVLEDDTQKPMQRVKWSLDGGIESKFLRLYRSAGSDTLILHIGGNQQGMEHTESHGPMQAYLKTIERVQETGAGADVAFAKSGDVIWGELYDTGTNPEVALQHVRNILPMLLRGKRRLVIAGFSRGAGMAEVLSNEPMEDGKPFLHRDRFPQLEEVTFFLVDPVEYRLQGIGGYPLERFPNPDVGDPKNVRVYTFAQEDKGYFTDIDFSGEGPLRSDGLHRRVWRYENKRRGDSSHSDIDDDFAERLANASVDASFDHGDPLKSLRIGGEDEHVEELVAS